MNPHTVRLANSHFNSEVPTHSQIYFKQESILWQTTQLRTMKSYFIKSNMSIESNSDNFLKKAETEKFFKVDFAVKIEFRETKYASSKYENSN